MNDSRKVRGEEIKNISKSKQQIVEWCRISQLQTCNLYCVQNHKHGKLILKTKNIYILKYICLYILRFILLFSTSLPFYNFLQVIGVVIGLGWVRNLPPKLGKGTSARAGLTSDTSLGSLPFDGNAFSVRSRLCFDSKILLNTIVNSTVSY